MNNDKEGRDHKSFNLLIIEDSDLDAAVIRDIITTAIPNSSIVRVDNGEDGYRCIRKQGMYKAMPNFDLVFLDLNMPFMGGLELLSLLNKEGLSNNTTPPIAVITSSYSDADAYECTKKGAISYIIKTPDIEEFCSTLETYCRNMSAGVTSMISRQIHWNKDPQVQAQLIKLKDRRDL